LLCTYLWNRVAGKLVPTIEIQDRPVRCVREIKACWSFTAFWVTMVLVASQVHNISDLFVGFVETLLPLYIQVPDSFHSDAGLFTAMLALFGEIRMVTNIGLLEQNLIDSLLLGVAFDPLATRHISETRNA
jgi:hypothetical protein